MSQEQVPIDPAAVTGEDQGHGVHEVTHDLAYQRLGIVNVVYWGPPGAADRQWVLIDTGIPGSARAIRRAAAARFGEAARPAAILLTHGHFDHVGALHTLAEEWDTPVVAHLSEQPFLNGQRRYPPPDPTVGGGMMAAMAGIYPRGPVDVGPRLVTLPADGSLPWLPGWRWLATPGHTPGHVSLWRAADRTLIAGDAFITTRQESAYAVAFQKPELHGPPMYFTPDWAAARRSVETLAALAPERVITGHGPALHGPDLREALTILAHDFDRIAVPAQGRYVDSVEAGDQA